MKDQEAEELETAPPTCLPEAHPSAQENEPASPAGKWARPLLLLAIFALIIFAERLHTYAEPFDRDIATYAVIAHQILHGYTLYGDYLDQKPPAIHLTYALAELVAGYGRASIFLLTVAGSLLLLVAVFYAGSQGRFGTTGGLWAAGFFTIIGGHVYLEANQPNSELFINAMLTLGIGLLLHNRSPRLALWRAVAAGACFTWATLYKHSVVVVPACICAGLLLAPLQGRKRKHLLAETGIIVAVGLIGWLAVYAYFAANGRGKGFLDSIVAYNQAYAGSIQSNLLQLLNPAAPGVIYLWFPRGFYITVPLLVLIVLGVAQTFWSKSDLRAWIFLAVWAVGVELAVALPGRFWAHYYQLWLPPVIVGAGWACAELAAYGSRITPAARWAGALACAVLISMEAPHYGDAAWKWSYTKYGVAYLRSESLSARLNKMLRPGETFIQLGSEPELYLETQRPPPRVLADFGLVEGPLIELTHRMFLEDLDREKPEVVLLESTTSKQLKQDDPIFVWCRKYYEPAPTDPGSGSFFVYIRRGGAVEKRWVQGM